MIRIRGARTNNLRSVDIDIPRDQLVVITGRSGSGKSSLAFDTVYREGQRQFFESQPLSTRSFLRQLPPADVDSISGLPPTLCLDQNPGPISPRSTVGTISEIDDYLRLLMARVGDIRCHACGAAIEQQSVDQICQRLLELPEGTRMMLMSPVAVHQSGNHARVIEQIRREGLVRARIDGNVMDLESIPPLSPQQTHSIDAVTDRIIAREGVEERLAKAVDLSVKLSGGSVSVSFLTPDRINDQTRSDTTTWEEQLFSTKFACPQCDVAYGEVEPRSFNFNSPLGACGDCKGLGFAVHFDPDQVIPDCTKPLADRAIAIWDEQTPAGYRQRLESLAPLMQQMSWDFDTPVCEVPATELDRFFYNDDRNAPGLMLVLEKELTLSDDEDWRDRLLDMETRLPCNACRGSRLNAQANSVFLADQNMAAIAAMSLVQVAEFFNNLTLDENDTVVAMPLLKAIRSRLAFLLQVGVGYLETGRSADTLSGGELQRTRLGTSIGSGLAGVCYVLDEPSIGLHPCDTHRLIESIQGLRDAGNSVIVVEHDESTIRAADHIVDMGPGAGVQGGLVTATGNATQLSTDQESLTGRFLSGRQQVQRPPSVRPITGRPVISIRGACGFNLQNVDVDIPLGVFNCITGVSGSGKSTLILQTLVPAIRRHLELVSLPPAPHDRISGLDQIDSVVFVDQRPVGRSPRSCPATFTGLLDEFRKIFAATPIARQRGYTVSRFSFNSKSGRCPNCLGKGFQKVKMDFLADMLIPCEACGTKRFNPMTLQAKFGNFSIADVLAMTVDTALQQFDGFSRIATMLRCLSDVGLGYIGLGQPATTLSGGESQRLKLARELALPREGHCVYVLDEPTTGLHVADIDDLLGVLQKIVDADNTLIVIEHNLDVVANADWIIDLGPGGGSDGGQVVAVGTPERIASMEASATGRFLKPSLMQSP